MALPTKQDRRILKLYRALTKKNKYVAELFGNDPRQRNSSACGNTFLHIAIRFRQVELVDLLLETLPESLSNIRNDDGNTILHELAANLEWTLTAMKVVDKDPELLTARNKLNEAPIFSAVRHGQLYMSLVLFHLLDEHYQQNGEFVEECLEGDEKTTTVLHAAVTGEHFGLAHAIAWRFSHLIPKKDEDGMTAFQYLACNPRAFEKQKRKEEFLENSACNPRDFEKQKRKEEFPENSAQKMNKCKSYIDNFNKSQGDHQLGSYIDNFNKSQGDHLFGLNLKGLLTTLIENDTAWLSIDSPTIDSSEATELECKTVHSEIEISQGKNMEDPHGRNDQENEKQRYDHYKKSDESPLFLAIMSNNPVVVEAILLKYTNAMKHTSKNGMNVLQIAILYGHIDIFNLIINLNFLPHSLISVTDKEGNSLLHMVCHTQKRQADRRMKNPALQLRKECIFFQTVKEACKMHIRKPLNNRHQTAEELFAAKNEKLHREAKEWMTRTSENCIILSVFIATVAFAAAYTVPGGPDQNTGIPLLNSKPWFMVFIVADVISLTVALASVGIFLSILTSSFPLQDFGNSLFKKLRQGIHSMVLSVSVMVVAFGATIVLVMTHNWENAGWIVVGFLPVPIFFLSYSPVRSVLLGPSLTIVSVLLGPSLSIVSVLLGPSLTIVSTFTAKFLNWCIEILVDLVYCCGTHVECVGEALAGVRRNIGRAFSWICGQKSVERSSSRPPV